MLLLTVFQTWLLVIGIFLGVVIILAVLMYFLFGLRKKREKEDIKIDEEFISKLLLGLGGKDNILEFSADNGRVKFLIKDLDLIDSNKLGELSKTGVFISGKNIKMLFKYEADTVIKMLNKGE